MRLPSIITQSQVTLSKALADTTWASIISVYRRFQEFTQSVQTITSTTYTHPEFAVLFIQDLLSQNQIQPPSAHQYIVDLRTAWRIFAGYQDDTPLLATFQRALRRMGALVPKSQAPPLTGELLSQVIQRLFYRPRLRMAIIIAWLTAARGADLRSLTKKRFTWLHDRITVDFTGTKTDPFQEGLHSSVILPAHTEADLRRILDSSLDDEKIFPFSNAEITSALREVDPTLSAHSIRRGSLQALLLKGVPIESIQEFGRYKTLQGLLHYLPLAALPKQQKIARLSTLLGEEIPQVRPIPLRPLPQ